MKTSVNMIRRMGEFEVIQRTKDGMFNATHLAKQWNIHSGQRKDVSDFLRLSSTKEFAETIINKENGSTREFPYVKSKASRGENAGTWMHPFLFIDFSMWLNSSFKYDVIKFVYDNLIAFRQDAGDNYTMLSSSVVKLKSPDFSRMAKGLNWIVFNKHEVGIRNMATQEQLDELIDIERNLAFAIDMGYISSFDGLINEMKKLYFKKWKKAIA